MDSEALAAMLAALAPVEPKEGLTDPDEIPEPPDEPVTKPGDSGSSATVDCSAATPAARPTSTDSSMG